MSKMITRTVSKYTYPVSTVTFVDEAPQFNRIENFTFDHEATQKELMKIGCDKYPDCQLVFGTPIVEEGLYSVTVECFLEHATKIEKPVKEDK